MLSVHYKSASRDIVSEIFDGDVVVLDLSCGKYFSFTDSGSVVWQALSVGVQPDALLGKGNLPEADMQAFLRKLIDHNLLAVDEDGSAEPPSAELLSRLADAKEALDVVVFDDLADLFLADPIHDVEEERGWPMVRAN